MSIMPRFALVVALFAACGGGHRTQPRLDASVRASFRRCLNTPFTPPPARGFRHLRSRITAGLGGPRHVVDDAIVPAGQPAAVRVKVAYSKISKDLEGEPVSLWLDTCADWQRVATGQSNDDGRATLSVASALAPGVYAVRAVVDGDASSATAALWVLPRGARLVVTDVDATLTTSDSQLLQDNPAARPGGRDLLRAHDAHGHVVVYLTGRPYPLADSTRAWLSGGGFPGGPLVVTDSVSDALPTESAVGEFKTARVRELVAAGFAIEAAYGNATTDISAYLDGGVPTARIWIVGEHGGERGTQAVGDWTARAAAVAGN